jgi:hypothetical protein
VLLISGVKLRSERENREMMGKGDSLMVVVSLPL